MSTTSLGAGRSRLEINKPNELEIGLKKLDPAKSARTETRRSNVVRSKLSVSAACQRSSAFWTVYDCTLALHRPRHITSHRTTLDHITRRHSTTPHHITISHRITPPHTTPHHVTSHQTTPHQVTAKATTNPPDGTKRGLPRQKQQLLLFHMRRPDH